MFTMVVLTQKPADCMAFWRARRSCISHVRFYGPYKNYEEGQEAQKRLAALYAPCDVVGASKNAGEWHVVHFNYLTKTEAL